MKKLVVTTLILVMMISTMLMFTACGGECVHEFSAWTDDVAPTCTEPGHATRKCAKCGKVEEKDIPALGHNFVNGICTICHEREK